MSFPRNLSQICFGCEPLGGTDWGIVDFGEVERALHRALDSGVNFFDTAAVYGLGLSESRLGELLGSRRHDVYIATKGGLTWRDDFINGRASVRRDCSALALREGVESSLRRLKIDSIPIYYVHWPDSSTSFEETFESLNRLREKGLIRFIGVSNFDVDQIEMACRFTEISLLQVPCNLLDWEFSADLYRVLDKFDVGVVAYSVLANGLLSGKYHRNSVFPPTDRRSRLSRFSGVEFEKASNEIIRLREVAMSKGLSLVQYAIEFVLSQPRIISAIVGIKSVSQIEEACGMMKLEIK